MDEPDLSLLLYHSIKEVRNRMVTSNKTFAPDYPRDEHGWVVFPRDVELRRALFPKEAFEHPAKANLYMVREMARYLTNEGESVMDPFAGTGSQLISAMDNRRVVLIELEPYFLDLINKTVADWREKDRIKELVMIYEGDCRQVLQKMQFQVDAAIFSPPYSTTMASTGIRNTDDAEDTGTGRYKTKEYTRSSLNLSRLNPFLYLQSLDLVMSRLAARIKPGGRVCVISKDRMEGPNRILLSEPVINRAKRHGLVLDEWLDHRPPSTIAKASATIAKNRYGIDVKVVEEENLLVFKKPID
jgi:hypothetical protein